MIQYVFRDKINMLTTFTQASKYKQPFCLSQPLSIAKKKRRLNALSLIRKVTIYPIRFLI